MPATFRLGYACAMKDLREKLTKETRNVHDLLDEKLLRFAADDEHARRTAAGDSMTANEKIVSGVDEVKHLTEAELVAVKRKLRGH
jgi:hypothetical protein